MSIHHLILLLDFIIALVLGAGMILVLLRVAYHNRLFDVPGERKMHTIPVPRLGGMSFLPVIIIVIAGTVVSLYRLNLTSVSFTENIHLVQMTFMLVSALILYVIGVVDDLTELNYKAKMAGQFIASCVLVSSGLWIKNLYGLFGLYEIPGWFGIPLTILLLMYVTNAINMIDGLDGLASGICIICIACLCGMFLVERKFVYVMVGASTLGTIVAFWLFNMFGKQEKQTKLFMGDTGSLTLGLIICYLIINLGSFIGGHGVTTTRNCKYFILAFSSLMIPMLDVIRLIIYRLRHHKSPFLPDLNHIHHKIVHCGVSHRKALLIILGLDVGLILVNLGMGLLKWNINVILVIDILLFILIHWRINRHMKPLPEA